MQTKDEIVEGLDCAGKYPLWKECLEVMRASGLTYGWTREVEWFEKLMRVKLGENEFSFGMMAIRHQVEWEDGYYLKSSESGRLWFIPEAAQHEDVARGFEGRVRKYATRAISLRAATLDNPQAVLTDSERNNMEAALERASVRLILISRQSAVMDELKKHAPKILENK